MDLKAIYPGTFDPVTNGHTDIVYRATKLFSKVILAVSDSTEKKKTIFSLEQRVKLVKRALSDQKNIEVCSFNTLVTYLAREKKCHSHSPRVASGL